MPFCAQRIIQCLPDSRLSKNREMRRNSVKQDTVPNNHSRCWLWIRPYLGGSLAKAVSKCNWKLSEIWCKIPRRIYIAS